MRRIRLPSVVGFGDGRKGPQVKEGGQPLHSGKGEETDSLPTHLPAAWRVSSRENGFKSTNSTARQQACVV